MRRRETEREPARAPERENVLFFFFSVFNFAPLHLLFVIRKTFPASTFRFLSMRERERQRERGEKEKKVENEFFLFGFIQTTLVKQGLKALKKNKARKEQRNPSFLLHPLLLRSTPSSLTASVKT